MEEKKGFTVVDRRFAGADEAAQAPETASAPKPDPAETSDETPPSGEEGGTRGKEPGKKETIARTPMPPVDFATFVLSISSHIPVYLGEMADPYSGQTGTDLPMAQHLIDTLAMLQEKTRGNLDRTEENLLNGLLYDFRVRYVKAVQ